MCFSTRWALIISIDSGNLSEIAWSHFTHGFCQLLSNRLDDAAKHMRISQDMTEENGDLTLLARALTYLSVVYRKRSDIAHVREYATYDLKIAEEAGMPQYTGSALAQLAWLAWCDGEVTTAKHEALAAIQAWGRLGIDQTIFPFRWLALFPLLGVALQEKDIKQAAQCAQHMLTPPQQRLPVDLTGLLEIGVIAWRKAQYAKAEDLLHQALQKAHKMGYV